MSQEVFERMEAIFALRQVEREVHAALADLRNPMTASEFWMAHVLTRIKALIDDALV